MPSKFGWVDFAEEDRQRMLDVVQLFKERDTRDELGFGTIRDAFADYFFPGTSTIQTRAKYMLFVPWIYLKLEKNKVSSSKIQHRGRRDEIKLIYSLLGNGEKEGVIGGDAKKHLQRLPSSIYWYGLFSWGIRLFPGSQDQYHKYLDTHYHRQKIGHFKETDDEVINGMGRSNWHPGIPAPPENLFERPTLKLTSEEALYLKERVLIHHGKCLLANILNKGVIANGNFPWERPVLKSLPDTLNNDMYHARNFSETIHGASLLYNLMLSRASKKEDLESKYEEDLNKWEKVLYARQGEIQNWYTHIEDFWNSSALDKARIPGQTRAFVNRWFKFVFEMPSLEKLIESKVVQSEIANREVQLKGKRARLENKRALEMWRGSSGTTQLSYRWDTARRFCTDIIDGLS